MIIRSSSYVARHRAPRPRVRPVLASLVSLLAGLGLVAVLHVPGAEGAYLASIANSTNTAQTAAYFTCTAAAVGESTTRAYAAYPLNEVGAATATDVSGNGHNASYTTLGVTQGVAGPCPRDYAKAATFDGLTGGVYDSTGVATSAQQSDEIWFRTNTTGGGLLIASYSVANPLLGGGGADRVVYMTTSGQLVFGVYNTSTRVATSPLAYNDNNWHEAQGVLSTTAGASLYVDGALVANNSTATTANTFTEYTRLAVGSLSGWPNVGGTGVLPGAWRGSLAYAAIYRYPLTAQQVQQHYTAGR